MVEKFIALGENDQGLFQLHAVRIGEAVREVFPSIPANFELKPATIRKIHGCGVFYDFKIALPDGQFAQVSFHLGGYPIYVPPGEEPPSKPTGPHFEVDPTPSSSAYE